MPTIHDGLPASFNRLVACCQNLRTALMHDKGRYHALTHMEHSL